MNLLGPYPLPPREDIPSSSSSSSSSSPFISSSSSSSFPPSSGQLLDFVGFAPISLELNSASKSVAQATHNHSLLDFSAFGSLAHVPLGVASAFAEPMKDPWAADGAMRPLAEDSSQQDPFSLSGSVSGDSDSDESDSSGDDSDMYPILSVVTDLLFFPRQMLRRINSCAGYAG